MSRTFLLPLFLAVWLVLSAAAFAQDDSDQPAPDASTPADTASDTSSGPVPTLTPALSDVSACNVAGSPRYLEIRGTGFDAFVDQRLPGQLMDADGNLQERWRTIWVDPNGNVTLAVNLCDDVALQRGPLAPGTYFVTIGDGSGGDWIAATSFDLSDQPPPPRPTPTPAPTYQPGTQGSVVVPTLGPSNPSITLTPGPVPTYVAPSTSSAPRTGPGSLQQPLPIGSTITLFDNWQLTVTGVTPDAWAGIHNAVPSNIGPASDMQYFVVRVQAIYTGTSSAVFSDLRLGLASPTSTYDQINNSCGLIPDEVQPTPQINGGVVRGNVCFAVRKSDANSLAFYDTLAPAADRTYVALH